MNGNKVKTPRPATTEYSGLPLPPEGPPCRTVKHGGDWAESITIFVFIMIVFGVGFLIGIKFNGC